MTCFFRLHLLKRQLKWFGLRLSDESLALLHVLHINYVSQQTFGLRLKFETLVSPKDKMAQCFIILA